MATGQGNINFASETRDNAIRARFGNASVVHAQWQTNHHINMRRSPDWYLSQRAEDSVIGGEAEDKEEEPYLHDGDHILLFPQDKQRLFPMDWIVVAWPFLEKFRSNLSYHPEEAFFYTQITLLGDPGSAEMSVGRGIESELKDEEWRRVERIYFTTAGELESILSRRMNEGIRFRGYDEGEPTASSKTGLQ